MSFPALPDSFYKLLVYLGIGLIVYAFISRQNEYIQFENQRLDFNSNVRKLDYQREQLNAELTFIKEEADYYSKRFNIPNPLIVSDSGYSFTQTIRGDKRSVALSDTISHILTRFKTKKKEIADKDAELAIQRYIIDEKESDFKQVEYFSMTVGLLGLLMFLGGLSIWTNSEKLKESILHRQNLSLPTYSNCCQSCGVVFDRIARFGREENGEVNYNFCNECYCYGKFSEPNINVDQMIEKVKSCIAIKLASKDDKRLQNKLRGLDRWKFNRYL